MSSWFLLLYLLLNAIDDCSANADIDLCTERLSADNSRCFDYYHNVKDFDERDAEEKCDEIEQEVFMDGECSLLDSGSTTCWYSKQDEKWINCNNCNPQKESCADDLLWPYNCRGGYIYIHYYI